MYSFPDLARNYPAFSINNFLLIPPKVVICFPKLFHNFILSAFAWKAKRFAFAGFLHFVLLHNFSGTSPNSEQKKHFTDHHTPYTIHGFRDWFPVHKMHDCYFRIRKNFDQHFIYIQATQSTSMGRWKQTTLKSF